MSTDIAESLPKRKFAPAAMAKSDKKSMAPAPKGGGKKGGKPESKGGSGKGASEEGSEKRIRQAVYDIRYRARREDIDLKAAFAQYMSNSSLSQADRTAVREKIFGKSGGVSEKFIVGADDWASDNVANALYQVFVERDKSEELQLAYLQQLDEDEVSGKKYKVRVTDKNGRSYVRFADRAKITELRQNPNIESVEMTEHGDAYEGERKKGKLTARAKGGGLDPVGKEDKDIDNDGDHDKTDKYLLKRRKAIGKAIRKRADKKIKEAFIADGTISTEPKNPTKITGKGVDNYKSGAVTVNPVDAESDANQRKSVYSHLELNGSTLSESQKKLYEMMKMKEKKKEEDKGKLDDMATKDTIKKDDEKKEEKPDTRGMYAKIAMVKNKLRSMGQANPMVMAVDACEENIVERGSGGAARDNYMKKKREEGTPTPTVQGETSDKPNQPGSGVKKEIGTDIGNKFKGVLKKVDQQVKKNPMGFTLQNTP